MSVKIRKCREFFHLLLSTDKIQALALLKTASEDQLHCITEISHNLLQITLKGEISQKVRKRRHILKHLANKKTSYKAKSKLLYKHSISMLDTLLSFKRQILELTKK